MQKLFIFALCLAVATAGVVSPVRRCGGVGTFIQLRVTDCEGICSLYPGTRYDIETDMIPSSAAPALHLRVTVNVFGFDTEIVSTILSNSSVQPGLIYTLVFYMVPNDILGGNLMTLNSYISHSGGTNPGLLELCLENDVWINF